ncbi:MAG: hypothetical protein Q9194_003175 [Teloschistes cf. exilis]
MGRIQEMDKLKYGCSLCFTDIGAGPLVQFTNYSGMNRDDVEWTCEICTLELFHDRWRINYEEDLHDNAGLVADRRSFPMHTVCWRLLEACWDRKTVTTPVNLDILADFFISQPRGLQLPHMLEGNWVTSGLKFLTGDFTRYRDPDDYTEVEVALDLLIFPDSWPRFKRKTPSLLVYGKPDCFSLLAVEIRLIILCFLPTEAVEAAREASVGLAFVPLEGTFWLSRLSDPEYCHLPKHLALHKGDQQQPGDVPQWFLALQEDKMRNKNRLRIIAYNEMLIDKMIQRQHYLRKQATPNLDTISKARYFELITCADEPHPAYQKAERTLTWTSEILFNFEIPFSSVAALTPAFTGSYGGKYLSGLIFHTDQNSDLVLGHRSPCLGCRIDISDPKSYTNNIILQSDSRGIFEIRPQRNGPPIMQLRRHGKIVLDPAVMSGIAGLRAELSLVCLLFQHPFIFAGRQSAD